MFFLLHHGPSPPPPSGSVEAINSSLSAVCLFEFFANPYYSPDGLAGLAQEVAAEGCRLIYFTQAPYIMPSFFSPFTA